LFGGENRPFVVAMRSSHAVVVAPFGAAVIDRLSVCGVVHCPDPIPHLQSTRRALRDTLYSDAAMPPRGANARCGSLRGSRSPRFVLLVEVLHTTGTLSMLTKRQSAFFASSAGGSASLFDNPLWLKGARRVEVEPVG
jgi:hypothetical protein